VAVTRYTLPYVGTPAYYTGTGTSQLVPDVFPVAIAGHAYMLDIGSNRFARAFEARLRDSQDSTNIPGEAAINPQGLWRRSQVSWHKGSGQQYGDTAEGLDTRFYTSKNVDVWTKGQLSLLPTTDVKLSSSETNLQMVVAGDYVYVADGQQLKRSSDLSTWTNITGGPAAAITCLATDGYNVFVGYSGSGLKRTYTDVTTLATYISGSETYTNAAYVKGRVMASAGNDLANFTADVTTSHSHTSGLISEHPNEQFVYTGFAEGTAHIYVGGYVGGTSLIYRMAIKADGTSLDVPVQAGALPIGEQIESMFGYLGYVMIGTNKGVRVATSDANGDLVIGPTLETTDPVRCFTADGRFVWYGWTDFDGSSVTGLGRLDLSELVGVNEPAYASDLMASTTGDVRAVVNWNGKRLFTVAGAGVYYESTDLASEGYIDTGTWRWGIPDRKFVAFVDFRTEPLNGGITMSCNLDNAGYEALAPFGTQGATEKSFDGPETGFGEAAFKVTLTRDSTDATSGPVLTRWQVRAFPAPRRSELFSIPVLLHRKISRFGRDYYIDVMNELAYLRGLIDDARIVSYQEGYTSYRCVIENVEWTPIDAGEKPWEYDGTAVVTLRSLVA
jgi:hypothetical protein